MSNKNTDRFSRYLTCLLRHKAVINGYDMDRFGFVEVDEIISKCHDVTLEKIQKIVESDSKKRFELAQINNKWYIRAVQGHSISGIDPNLRLITDPSEIPIVVHGTNSEAYKTIEKQGLSKMDRNHIHFAHGTLDDTNVISGMRKTANIMIYIDVPKAMDAGIKFYKSSNNVILSEGIDGIICPSFFLRVEKI